MATVPLVQVQALLIGAGIGAATAMRIAGRLVRVSCLPCVVLCVPCVSACRVAISGQGPVSALAPASATSTSPRIHALSHVPGWATLHAFFPLACCEWWLCGRPTLMLQGGSVGAPVLPPAAAAATPSPAPASAVPPPPRARAPAAPMPGPAPAPLPVRVCPCVWCANRTSQGRPCHVPCQHALDVGSWDGMALPWAPSLPLRPWCVYCCCSFGSSLL
jgi:hypothetical protein